MLGGPTTTFLHVPEGATLVLSKDSGKSVCLDDDRLDDDVSPTVEVSLEEPVFP